MAYKNLIRVTGLWHTWFWFFSHWLVPPLRFFLYVCPSLLISISASMFLSQPLYHTHRHKLILSCALTVPLFAFVASLSCHHSVCHTKKRPVYCHCNCSGTFDRMENLLCLNCDSTYLEYKYISVRGEWREIQSKRERKRERENALWFKIYWIIW